MKAFLKKPLFWGVTVGGLLLVAVVLMLRKRSIVQKPLEIVNKAIDSVPTV